MKILVEVIEIDLLITAVVYLVVKIYNYLQIKKLKKSQKNKFLKFIKASPNLMAIHIQKVANFINEQLKISENLDERAQILDDYYFYVGIYDKIKINQNLSDNELITFAKFYLDFTKIIEEIEKEEETIKTDRINELSRFNLN